MVMQAAATAATGLDAGAAMAEMTAMTKTSMAMQTNAAVNSAEKEINATVMQPIHDMVSNAKNLARTG